jgi:hypothetical protein
MQLFSLLTIFKMLMHMFTRLSIEMATKLIEPYVYIDNALDATEYSEVDSSQCMPDEKIEAASPLERLACSNKIQKYEVVDSLGKLFVYLTLSHLTCRFLDIADKSKNCDNLEILSVEQGTGQC